MKKRILAIVLSVCMIMSNSIYVLAEDGENVSIISETPETVEEDTLEDTLKDTSDIDEENEISNSENI